MLGNDVRKKFSQIIQNTLFHKIHSLERKSYGIYTLSIKNKWIDDNGLIYLILTRKEAMEKLNISDKTATKAFKQLKEYKLIDEKI